MYNIKEQKIMRLSRIILFAFCMALVEGMILEKDEKERGGEEESK